MKFAAHFSPSAPVGEDPRDHGASQCRRPLEVVSMTAIFHLYEQLQERSRCGSPEIHFLLCSSSPCCPTKVAFSLLRSTRSRHGPCASRLLSVCSIDTDHKADNHHRNRKDNHSSSLAQNLLDFAVLIWWTLTLRSNRLQ